MTSNDPNKPNVVWFESLQHPLTLFPTAAGVLGSFSTALFGATTLSTGIAVGGLAIGVGSWAVNYFLRRNTFMSAHLRQLQAQSEARMRAMIQSLEQSLKNLHLTDDPHGYGQQALQQFGLIQDAFETFKSILTDKLDPNELSFGRFLITAEQVNLAVLDNLQSITTRLKSVKAIDPKYIASRRQALSKIGKLDPADQEELATLEQREKLRVDQLGKVNELLTFNEQALTKLARANAAVTEMRGKGGHTSLDLASATEELEEIAKRAQKL